ncbi:MAG: Rap1a/Tai family immunity protein [Gammaproteobacteria bacterium]|nr:Rap1a/Tai family immunity protein [Gammaproteobacteria bacterium]
MAITPKTLLLLAGFLPLTVPATELVYMTGRQLLDYCGSTDAATLDRGLCEGYLTGLADGATTLRTWQRAAPGFCVPADASPFKLRRVFVEWAQEYESELNNAAAGLALNAFRQHFPCR